jgi:hypothetical protein
MISLSLGAKTSKQPNTIAQNSFHTNIKGIFQVPTAPAKTKKNGQN